MENRLHENRGKKQLELHFEPARPPFGDQWGSLSRVSFEIRRRFCC